MYYYECVLYVCVYITWIAVVVGEECLHVAHVTRRITLNTINYINYNINYEYPHSEQCYIYRPPFFNKLINQ